MITEIGKVSVETKGVSPGLIEDGVQNGKHD